MKMVLKQILSLRMCLMCLILISVFGKTLYVNAQEKVNVSISGIDLRTLLTSKSPIVMEQSAIDEELKRITSALEALTHMSQMIADEHARTAMNAQIQAIKAKFKDLEAKMKQAPTIQVYQDHQLSGTTQNMEKKQVDSTLFSQIWGGVEQAQFDEDKVKLIKQYAGMYYFTTRQATLLLEAISFSQNRKEALIAIYPKLVDQDQAEDLFGMLDHERDQKSARQLLMKNR